MEKSKSSTRTWHAGARTWHAGKPKKKPGYDAEAVTKELLDAVVEIYGGNNADCEGDGHRSLRAVAEQLETKGYGSLNPAKVKKLLITAGVYKTGTTEQIRKLREDGHSVEQIMIILNLSKAAVNNNLPYEKVVYKMDESGGEVSVNADKVRLYKKRKRAVEKLREEVDSENLWNCIVAFEGYPFETTSGLPFTYTFKLNRHGMPGNEIVVSRKEKTITRSSVEKALAVVMSKGEYLPVKMSTPKELNVFGASYIYPLFIRFGLVEHVGSHQRGGPRKGSKRRSMGSNSDVGNTQQE